MARSSHAHPTTLNPQIMGLAENALQAILNRALARTGGSTCQHWMALSLTAADGGAIDREQLIGDSPAP